MKFFGTQEDDDAILERDEILKALMHRAAYRTQVVMRWVLIAVAITLIGLVHDETWNTVGYMLFAVFFLTSVIFEVILAYDGVFQGLDELRRKVIVDKRTVYRRAGWTMLDMIIFSLVLGHIMDDDASVIDDVFQGIILGIGTSVGYLYRWRHILRKSLNP